MGHNQVCFYRPPILVRCQVSQCDELWIWCLFGSPCYRRFHFLLDLSSVGGYEGRFCPNSTIDKLPVICFLHWSMSVTSSRNENCVSHQVERELTWHIQIHLYIFFYSPNWSLFLAFALEPMMISFPGCCDFSARSRVWGCVFVPMRVSTPLVGWRPFSLYHELFLSSVYFPKNFVVSAKVVRYVVYRLLSTMPMISFSVRSCRTLHLEIGKRLHGPLHQPFLPHRDSSCISIVWKEATPILTIFFGYSNSLAQIR